MNPAIHFEFTTADPEALGKFYNDLFGWQAKSAPGDYILIDTLSGKGINGGIMKGDNAETLYMVVPSLQPALDKIESLGGKTTVPPTTIPDMITFAQFSDPSGNVLGLVQPGQGPPPERTEGGKPAVDWFEIMGADGKALAKFYEEAFGWKLNDSGAEGFDYFMTDRSVEGSPGAVGSTPDKQPVVRFYAGVDDVEETLKKAEGLGAKTVMEPSQVAEDTTIAIFVDPQGHQFGLYKGM